jgi:SAM-dependent methyltransferase
MQPEAVTASPRDIRVGMEVAEAGPGPVTGLDGRPCVGCGSPLRLSITDWTARCPTCGTWASALHPSINKPTLNQIDEEAREIGLRDLRQENFGRILDLLASQRSLAGSRLLDVGSGHGWFLDVANRAGASASGIEPDAQMVEVARARGLDVRAGFFPQDLPATDRFDIIAFNDVLEHIPDARSTLEACHRLLSPDGLLAINVPNADGIGFRTARLLRRVGVAGPYDRFWQVGLPSPHVHYFTGRGIEILLERCGFRVLSHERLPSVSRTGLWERVHLVQEQSPISFAYFVAVWLTSPLLNWPPLSDIQLILASPGH